MEAAFYYTPKPEEIRVGFEAELLVQELLSFGTSVPQDYWQKVTVTEDNLWEMVGSCDHLRVKFLDPIEIVEEGWKYIGGYWYEWGRLVDVGWFSNKPVSFRMNFVDVSTRLIIQAFDKTYSEWETVYGGRCLSLNELRQVQDLLGIK